MILAILFSISGCDNEGIVGEGLNPSGERVETTSYDLDNIDILADNGFSGKLSYTAMGIVEDPEYGTITSTSLIKPSINPEDLDELPDDHKLKLLIEFNSLRYGDENSVSEYNIYEINQRWRGPELTYNNPVSFDQSNPLGSFQVTDESSVEVDLDEGWVNRYREFFNSEDALRDSLYRFEFPGLAIVPANQNRKIDFISHQVVTTDEDTTLATRFLVENDQDSLIATVPVLDHGTSMTRSDVPANESGIVLHNTMENILKVDLGVDAAEFSGKEIVNAQVVFTIDNSPDDTAPPGFTRPETVTLLHYYFGSEPLDISSELFVRAPGFSNLDEDEEQFKINVTSYFVDSVLGDIGLTPLYFSNQGYNGLFYSVTLHDSNAPENLRPRLIITTINPEN